jgi:predicted O-methyltransferase YrrM
VTLDAFRVAVDQVRSAGQVREPYGLLLYSLVRYLRPATVVEVGTWCGYSCAWLAQGLLDNQHGHLVAIDDWSLSGASLEETAKTMAAFGLGGVVTLRDGDSLRTEWPRPSEFVYLDGNHSLETVAYEVDKADRLGARTIVLHDTTSWWGPVEFVDRVRWATAKLGEKSQWDFVEFPHAEGLTVLNRRSRKPGPEFNRSSYPEGIIRAVSAPA